MSQIHKAYPPPDDLLETRQQCSNCGANRRTWIAPGTLRTKKENRRRLVKGRWYLNLILQSYCPEPAGGDSC